MTPGPHSKTHSPPAISETQFKKIEDGKFVDFTDLLPENQALDININSDEPCIDIDKQGSLRFKDNKNKKARVNSFHRWSTAWCVFAQAHLHFFPADYFELFMYHSNMVQFVNAYKYQACFEYDRDFRLRMQHERKAVKKTVWWSRESEELRNKHLLNNPLPHCKHCKSPGHRDDQCRQKPHNNSNETAHHSHGNQNNNSYQQGRPPNNNNFRPHQNNNTSQSRSMPPSKKYCFRFSDGTPCSKPHCMFLHACERCGDNRHGAHACPQFTSTNFIPGP